MFGFFNRLSQRRARNMAELYSKQLRREDEVRKQSLALREMKKAFPSIMKAHAVENFCFGASVVGLTWLTVRTWPLLLTVAFNPYSWALIIVSAMERLWRRQSRKRINRAAADLRVSLSSDRSRIGRQTK